MCKGIALCTTRYASLFTTSEKDTTSLSVTICANTCGGNKGCNASISN